MKCANCNKTIKESEIYFNGSPDTLYGQKYCEKCDFGGNGNVRVINGLEGKNDRSKTKT